MQDESKNKIGNFLPTNYLKFEQNKLSNLFGY